MKILQELFVSFLLIGIVEGYSAGSPLSLCYDPYPHHHGHYAATESSPYHITVNPITYSPGELINVTITGSQSMKGVVVAARSTTGDWMYNYGSFTQIPAGTKGYKYYSEEPNCVTHNGSLPENTMKLEFTWKAPNSSIGDIIFSSSVVQDFTHFWINHTALLRAEEPVDRQPISRIQMASDFDSELDLEKCGDKNGCIKYPAGCTGRTCSYYVTYKMEGDNVKFRLMNKEATTANYYLSLGISADVWMPRDETLTCVLNGKDVIFNHGYTPSYHNSIVLNSKVYDLVASSSDGVMMCEFTRPIKSPFTMMGSKGPVTFQGDLTDGIDEPKYHLYLAWGQIYKGSYSNLKKHVHIPIISKTRISFSDKSSHTFYTLHDSVKVHATFMLSAWFGTAAIAMILARYFRNGIVFENQKLCGAAAWFQIHRGLAFTTGILTAISFIIIFAHYQKWTQAQSVHAGFGIAVTAMVLIQILASFARPDPDSPKRPVFNWLHRILGSLTYITAAVTMFLGSKMTLMPRQMVVTGTGLLAGLVAVHLVFMLVFQFLDCCSADDSDSKDQNSIEMKEKESHKKPTTTPSSAHNSIKSGLLAVYMTLITALLVCFLAVLWLY